MGLLNSYSSANRVVLNGKTVSYSKSRIYGQWSYVSGVSVVTIYQAWEYHRYCQKTYQYVGMDYTTASKCAEEMIKKYTRSYDISEWNSNTGTFTDKTGSSMCMADVTIQKVAGHLYNVIISVREDDAKIRTTSLTPSGLFVAENNRDYDEGK